MLTPKLFTTLRGYDRRTFAADVAAGITVALVALPLSLAIAIASNAPPATGLVTAIVAGFLISALGGSRVQIGGPTGAFIVVVAGVISTHGYDGLVIATLMAGVMLVALAYFKAGSLIHYVPEAVINGFTIGIACVIAASQLKDLFGLSVETVPADFIAKIGSLWAVRETFNATALVVGLTSMVAIVVMRRLAPSFPGLVVVVAAASAAVAYLGLEVETIESRFGILPSSLPMPKLPSVSVARLAELLPSALVIAFLAGVESLLSAMVADRMVGSKHRPNAELMAQGVANIGSSLFGGLPATGAIARTATNVRAGGKTPMAGITHAVVILIMVMLAAPLASQLVLPALAGLLILTAWNMSEPHRWGEYMRARPSDRFLLILTAVLTLLVDLTVAIGVGVIMGLVIRMRRRGVPQAEWRPPEP